jgi:DNA (cytosine-5)-methyltransferase 1
VAEYGVPQKRKRVIILGLNRSVYGDKAEKLLDRFYSEVLPSYKDRQNISLREAIGDLPGLYPMSEINIVNGRKTLHSISETKVKNHVSRYHNKRDMELFKMLADDIACGVNRYASIEARKDLYTVHTGRTSNIHKYNVLKWDEPSTTIPAHLCKDGLRHIHPDPKQARTITVREAARIQTFPDDYEFIGPMTAQYKMIGNAVPPEFARRLALAIYELLFKQK